MKNSKILKTSKFCCRHFIYILILAANLFYVQSALAYKIGHLEFNILSEDERTVDVGWEERPPSPHHGFRTDSIVIPPTVTINNKEYRVTQIRKNGFDELICDYIDIPSSVEVINQSAFEKLAVDTIILKPGLREIGKSAFSGSWVRYCSVPNTVEIINDYAWKKCWRLETIDWPQNLTVIPDYCFAYCGRLKFDFKNITKIGWDAFSFNEMEQIYFPAGIHIGNGAFGCSHAKQITFELGPTFIERNAFLSSNELEELELPEGITVDDDAFIFCNNLKRLVIHDNVTFILGSGTFNSTPDYQDDEHPNGYIIERIVYLAKNPQSLSQSMFSDATYLDGNLYVLPEAYETAKVTEPWSLFENIYPISDGVQQVVNSQQEFETKSEILFDLQGRKVDSEIDNLNPGVYISIKGNNRSKIIVR